MALSFYNELLLDPYNKALFNLLKNVESAETNAYLDVKGIPTTGIGFNLMVAEIRNAIFTKFGLDWDTTKVPRLFTDLTPAQRAVEDAYIAQITLIVTSQYPAKPTAANKLAFAKTLNDIMADRYSKLSPENQAKTRASFSFADNTDTGEMRPIFDLILPTYEQKVTDWLAGIPKSKERVALTSLAFNQTDGSSALLGKKRTKGVSFALLLEKPFLTCSKKVAELEHAKQ